MRAYIELDGEAAGWGPTRILLTELKTAGYTVDEYIVGDHMKDLLLRGSQDIGLHQSNNPHTES